MNHPLRVHVATLGCDKNLVDSEALLDAFRRAGLQPVADADSADIWILNTCSFIDAARRDSYDAIETLLEAKGDRRLVVTGCLAQETGRKLREAYPEIDLIGGVGNFEELAADLGAGGRGTPSTTPDDARYAIGGDRPLLTPAHTAFVKLGEGCNLRCAFCRIPRIRGRLRSRSIAEIRDEARRLAERGVRELNLISQNTSDYGVDTGETLPDLARALAEIDELRWLRFYYFFPGRSTGATLQALLEVPKVVPYVDLPMQHAAPRILRAMHRPADSRRAAAMFSELRRRNPDLTLRTTMLLGFPGETEEDVEVLADFLAEVEFDHLGTYRYSPEEGTPAAALGPGPDPEEVADREARILDLQAEISLSRLWRRLGRDCGIVVDRLDPGDRWRDVLAEMSPEVPEVLYRSPELAVARSAALGYDQDGVILLPAAKLKPGDWLTARLEATSAFDAAGIPVD